MSESGAFVTGGGGFVRVRDNAAGGFAAEFNQQKKLEADRLAKQQAEQDRRAAFRAEENEKQRAAKEADAAKAFREYHNNPASRGGIGSIYRYTEARFGRCYDVELKQGLAELNSPEMLERFYPER